MPQIAQSDARGLFTKNLIDVYQERTRPKGFLRSLFPSVFSPTKEVSIEVERGFEKIAVDVIRGSEGNANRFSKSTEKIWVPPMWREYFSANELDIYDRVLGSQGTDNTDLFVELLNRVADRIGLLQDKIERSKELMCAQVLQTGIVTTDTMDSIDFKRKAASIKDWSGSAPWSTGGSDVFAHLKTAAEFLRTVGKCGDAMFDVILGSGALDALLKNTTFLTRQNLFNMALDQVASPTQGSVGSAFHGTVTGGSYKFRLWTYPEFYDNAAGESTPYIDDENIIVLPLKPRFKFAHALVPQVVSPGETSAPKQGEWVYGEFLDTRKAKHDFDVQSAGLPIPVAIDQIYTAKVIA